MAKRILTLCLALVIGIAFAMPAVAAVKSIKVGGDLTIRGIYRNNLGFMNYDIEGQPSATVPTWLMSTTRIWVAADLTDNVSAVVRLLNERDWASTNENDANTDIDLDQAYIKMKDLFIPGLSATIGRQEILLGKGFVVGSVNGITGSKVGDISAYDLTARKAFDAVRIDYEIGTAPVTVTVFDAKVIETAYAGIVENYDNSDLDLWGLNVGYKTDNLNIAGYVLLLDNQTPHDFFDPNNNFVLTRENTALYTFGARIDHNVFPGLNYNLEAALQNGELRGTEDMAGWAGNADVSYTFQSPMELKLGGAWYYVSGDDEDATKNFALLYPDNLSDRIGRIMYKLYLDYGFLVAGNSGISVPKVYASFKPSEKNTLALAWFPANTTVGVEGEDAISSEIDLGYTYQYTEDVSLGICVDYAKAGALFTEGNDNLVDSAWEVIGTVAVAF